MYLVESSDLTNVSGIGESKAEILIKSGIDSANRLNKLNLNIGDKIPGTNITYSRNIDTGLKFYLATNNERIPRELAKDYLIDFKNYLISKKLDYLEIYPVGSYRRHKSTIGDIDIILTPKVGYEIVGDELTQVSDWFDSLFVSGSTKVAGIKGKTQVDVRLIDRKYLGAHILHGTGSQEFNIKLRAHAKSLGYRLNEYGIVVGDELMTFDNELDIFKYLNYQYIEPKYR
jgi:DNA polymerase/3'-5' exonuclease PolX